MKHKYATYEVARRIKELGFNEATVYYWEIIINGCQDCRKNICFCGPGEYKYYNKEGLFYYSAPTYSEIISWLRNEFNYYIYIIPRFDGFDGAQYGCHYSIFKEGDKEDRDAGGDGSYSFEEAEENAVLEVVGFLEEERRELLINEK